MKWDILGKETVVLGDIKFYVGAKWFSATKEKAGFSRKLKVNNDLIKSGVTIGCIVDEKDAAQIASCEPEFVNYPLLATIFYGRKNSLYFAKISDELFWVVSYDNDGCVDIAVESDSIKELYSLRDYISEISELSAESDKFSIVNVGERVYLDDQVIDARVEHRPLTEEDLKDLDFSKYKIHPLVGNLKKKLGIGAFVFVASVGLIAQVLITGVPDNVIAIKEGQHSLSFTRDYKDVKSDYNKIVSDVKKSERMSMDKLILMGREEFNDYVLSRGLSNEDVVNNLIHIRDEIPVVYEGWRRSTVEYLNDKFLIAYERMGEAPVSVPYDKLDRELTRKLNVDSKLSISPVSLSTRGNTRTYNVVVERNQTVEYSLYLSRKREVFGEKTRSLSVLRQTQQVLDNFKREVETEESSVDFLGVFDRRDSSVVERIARRVKNVQESAKPAIEEMRLAIASYDSIKDVNPPTHAERLLNEMGIEGELFPLFQSTAQYSWSSPMPHHKFPRSVGDDKFKDISVINGSYVDLTMLNGVHGIWAVRDVLNMPYVFIDSVLFTESSSGATVKMRISVNELNQNHIL